MDKKIIGKLLEPSARSRYGPSNGSMKDNRSTGKPSFMGGKSNSKSKYEGGRDGNTASLDYLEDLEDSQQVPSSFRPGEIDINRGPIRDSNEEPMPKKRKNTTTGGSKNPVAMSGESFGTKNPLVGSSGGAKAIKKAQKIEENFLENEEDEYSNDFDNQF